MVFPIHAARHARLGRASLAGAADTEFEGRPRKLVLHANRNGFFYVLDRTTGEFLRATPFVEQLNWAKGIDAKGRPIEIPGMEPAPNGKRVCPSVRGASNWMSPSYNPANGPALCAHAGAMRRLHFIRQNRGTDEELRRHRQAKPFPKSRANSICGRSIREPARSAGNIP